MPNSFAEKCFLVKQIPDILKALRSKAKKHEFVMSLLSANIKENIHFGGADGNNSNNNSKNELAICTSEVPKEPSQQVLYGLIKTFEDNNDYLSAVRIALMSRMLLPFSKLSNKKLTQKVMPVISKYAMQVTLQSPKLIDLRSDSVEYQKYTRKVTMMSSNRQGKLSDLGYHTPTPYEESFSSVDNNNAREKNENINTIGVFLQYIKSLKPTQRCELRIQLGYDVDEDHYQSFDVCITAYKDANDRVHINIKSAPKAKREFTFFNELQGESSIDLRKWQRVFKQLV